MLETMKTYMFKFNLSLILLSISNMLAFTIIGV